MPSIHFGVYEERLRELEVTVERAGERIAPPPGFEPGTIGLTGRRSTS